MAVSMLRNSRCLDRFTYTQTAAHTPGPLHIHPDRLTYTRTASHTPGLLHIHPDCFTHPVLMLHGGDAELPNPCRM